MLVGSPPVASNHKDEEQTVEMKDETQHNPVHQSEYNSYIVENMKLKETEFVIGSPRDVFNIPATAETWYWERRRSYVKKLSAVGLVFFVGAQKTSFFSQLRRSLILCRKVF